MNRQITFCCSVYWLFVYIVIGIAANTAIAAPTNKPTGSVSRAQFTTLIINKEPIDQVILLGNDITQVYYFTDIRNLSGKTITHRWEYKGDVVADIPIEVEGPRWRTDSLMILDSSMLGKWTVLVVDDLGWVLKATTFEYVPSELARGNVR